MHHEYESLFPTTDFPFLLRIREKLINGAPFTINFSCDTLSPKSVRFGRNHDTVLNPPGLVAGFIFPNAELTRVASCLSLLIAGGSALVYVDDYQDQAMHKCLDFRRKFTGLEGEVRVEKIKSNWQFTDSTKTFALDLNQ